MEASKTDWTPQVERGIIVKCLMAGGRLKGTAPAKNSCLTQAIPWFEQLQLDY